MSEEDWKIALTEARGMASANLAREIDRATASHVPWKVLLAEYFASSFKSDAKTWDKLSRRVPSMLPGRRREPAGIVAVCVDSSGSIDEDLFSAFFSEVDSISAVRGVERWIVVADCEVKEVLGPEDPVPTMFSGGGGTSFGPAIGRAEELSADLIIYLTDGEGEYPPEPSTPVLWCFSTRRDAPYGRSICLKED
jgi:predicted metal-dependent peptidase